eukprot:1638301-Amphidinium_carterae.1
MAAGQNGAGPHETTTPIKTCFHTSMIYYKTSTEVEFKAMQLICLWPKNLVYGRHKNYSHIRSDDIWEKRKQVLT